MKLNELIEKMTVLETAGSKEVEIVGLACDSRQVKPGWMFVAVPGTKADGADYIADAVAKGAVAVVSENRMEPGRGVAHVLVPRARRALAEAANAYYGDLSHRMDVVGVTGTNGKTTTAYMIRNILRDAGRAPGLLGTVAYEIGERIIPASRTTPESPDIHAMFQQMKERGCDSVVMEVSSHALALDRVHGIDFRVGVFTNLTQDHLDFHEDMESYFAAKARLFESLGKSPERRAVIKIDDPWGRRLAEEHGIAAGIVTYGFGECAQVRAREVSLGVGGTGFHVETPWGAGRVHLKLLGRFNVHNALAALAAGGILGVGFRQMVATMERLEAVRQE